MKQLNYNIVLSELKDIIYLNKKHIFDAFIAANPDKRFTDDIKFVIGDLPDGCYVSKVDEEPFYDFIYGYWVGIRKYVIHEDFFDKGEIIYYIEVT